MSYLQTREWTNSAQKNVLTCYYPFPPKKNKRQNRRATPSGRDGPKNNPAILLGFLNSARSNRSNAEDFLQDWKVECRNDVVVRLHFFHLSEVLHPPWKSEAKSYEVLRLSRKVILANLKIWSSNCSPSEEIRARTSKPVWLMCLLYCPCHAKCIFADLLHMPHACQHFWNSYDTITLCSLSGMCRIHGAATQKTHPNFKKCPEAFSFQHFWLGNVLRTTPFQQANFQKCSETVNFQHCGFGNVPCTARACTFSTAQLPKVFPEWCFYITITI